MMRGRVSQTHNQINREGTSERETCAKKKMQQGSGGALRKLAVDVSPRSQLKGWKEWYIQRGQLGVGRMGRRLMGRE